MALLDDPIYKEYQRQRFFGTLGRIGQGLLSSRGRGVSPLERLAFGLTQGAGPGMNPMQMMQMRREQEKDQQRQARASRYSEMVGGLDPKTGIDWQTGRLSGGVSPQSAMAQGGGPTPQAAGMLSEAKPGGPLLEGVTTEQMGLLRGLDPETGMGLLAKRAFEKPEEKYETVQNPYGLGGVGQRGKTTGQITGYQKPEKPDRSLVEIADPSSPTGTKWVKRSEAVGQPGKPPSSLMRITGYDSEGRPLMEIGGRGGLEKKTRGNIEGELFKAREGLARLETIAGGFKPEYQELETRLGMEWTAFKEKYGGLPFIPDEVSPEARQLLTEYTIYQRDAIDNINRHIQAMTGAAMGIDEAKRIRQGVPDPGEGILPGDSATEFQAKMLGTIRSLKLATARYSYALRNGLDWREIDLGNIEDIMRKRMSEIEREVRARNPNIGQSALDRLLSHTLGVEFGLLGAD